MSLASAYAFSGGSSGATGGQLVRPQITGNIFDLMEAEAAKVAGPSVLWFAFGPVLAEVYARYAEECNCSPSAIPEPQAGFAENFAAPPGYTEHVVVRENFWPGESWNEEGLIDLSPEMANLASIVGPGLAARFASRIAAAEGRAVIGKLGDLAAGSLGQGERTLLNQLEKDLGSPKANWLRNSSVLRAEMKRGVPIRDASVNPVTGALRNNTGFLRAERNLLANHGWTYNPATRLWSPPVP